MQRETSFLSHCTHFHPSHLLEPECTHHSQLTHSAMGYMCFAICTRCRKGRITIMLWLELAANPPPITMDDILTSSSHIRRLGRRKLLNGRTNTWIRRGAPMIWILAPMGKHFGIILLFCLQWRLSWGWRHRLYRRDAFHQSQASNFLSFGDILGALWVSHNGLLLEQECHLF